MQVLIYQKHVSLFVDGRESAPQNGGQRNIMTDLLYTHLTKFSQKEWSKERKEEKQKTQEGERGGM